MCFRVLFLTKNQNRKGNMVRYLEDELDCVWVNAAGNDDVLLYADTTGLPPAWKYSGNVDTMMLAGATSKHGLRSRFSLPLSNGRDTGFLWAPGLDLYHGEGAGLVTGTSAGRFCPETFALACFPH